MLTAFQNVSNSLYALQADADALAAEAVAESSAAESLRLVQAQFKSGGASHLQVLTAEHIPFVMVEARARIGGRAWTQICEGFPIDLGCGWLHSGDKNPWCAIAESHGFHIDRTQGVECNDHVGKRQDRLGHCIFRKVAERGTARAHQRFDQVFLMPWKVISLPGIRCCGSSIQSSSVLSLQTTPDDLSADE